MNRRLVFVLMLLSIFWLELFNLSVTEFALSHWLGTGSRWVFVIAIFFCGIDLWSIVPQFTTSTSWFYQPVWVKRVMWVWLVLALLNAAIIYWAIVIASHDLFISAVTAALFFVCRGIVVGIIAVHGEAVFV